MVQDVFPVVGHVKIFKPIVVIVARAHPLAPAGMRQTRLFGDIGEAAVAVVVIEMVCRGLARSKTFELRAVYDENVRPSVVVIIKDGNSGTRGFDDVFFCVFSAKDDRRGEPGLSSEVRETSDRSGGFRLSGARSLGCGPGNVYGKPGAESQQKERPKRREMESHQPPRIVRSRSAGVNPQCKMARSARRGMALSSNMLKFCSRAKDPFA